MLSRSIAILALLLLAAGCVSPPDPPAAGLGQVWGTVGATPKWESDPAGPQLDPYGEEEDEVPLPPGATLVDYEQVGPLVIELRGATLPTDDEAEVVLGAADFTTKLAAVAAGGRLVVRNDGTEALTVVARRGEETVFEVAVDPGASSEPQPVGDSGGPLELFTYEEEGFTAHVYVASGPYVLLGRTDRRFVLTDVSPGTYQLRAWHPRFPHLERDVTLTADTQTRADLDFSVETLPKVQ